MPNLCSWTENDNCSTLPAIYDPVERNGTASRRIIRETVAAHDIKIWPFSKGTFCDFSGLFGGIGDDPRDLVGAVQKIEIGESYNSKGKSEHGEPPGIIGDSFFSRFWPSNWGGATFGIVIGIVLCVAISWLAKR